MSPNSAQTQLVELDAALDSFWTRNVRLPSKQRNGARHVGCIAPLGDELVWMNDDDVVHHATDISLSQAIGKDAAHRTLVRIPALHVSLCAAEFEGGHLQFQQAIEAHLDELHVPAPHFLLWDPRGDGHISMVWQVSPLRLPKNRDPDVQHRAYARMHNAWLRARVKIALAFESLGGVVTLEDAPCPLPHAQPLHGPDADTYILASEYLLPDYSIREISEPLNATPWDALAQQRVSMSMEAANTDGQPGGKVYRFSAGHWLHMPKYRAALGPQKLGERHNAAKRVVCHQRWSGASLATLQAFMTEWNATQTNPLPEAELFDPQTGLVIWAVSKLVKGGPSRSHKQVPPVRGHYSRGDDVMDAVLSFLTHEGAAENAWEGTLKELADAASIESGVVVSERTLKRRVVALQDQGVTRTKVRVGRTWRTSWRLQQASKSDHRKTAVNGTLTGPNPHRVAGPMNPVRAGVSEDVVLDGRNLVFDQDLNVEKLKNWPVCESQGEVSDPHQFLKVELTNQKLRFSEEKFEKLASENSKDLKRISESNFELQESLNPDFDENARITKNA